MAILQFPQPKLAEKTGEGVWRLTGRVILPEDGSLDRAAALLGAWISNSVDVEILRKPFGVYLLLSGVGLVWPKKKKER